MSMLLAVAMVAVLSLGALAGCGRKRLGRSCGERGELGRRHDEDAREDGDE